MKSFTAIVDGVDYPQATQLNQVYDEVTAMQQALLSTGLAHHLFPDATTRTLGTSSKPWGTTYINALAFIGDTANANMTSGLTINQAGNDDEIVSMKSSDVAHGITAVTETDTYAMVKKFAAGGGVQWSGFNGAGNVSTRILSVSGSVDATRSTAAVAPVMVDAFLKSGTGGGTLGGDKNLITFSDAGTVRFILDSDGDSHQDVGTAWTNFDDRDDVLTLTALSAAVSRMGDPVREAFGALIAEHREALEAAKLVTFNADGHHFINWSRTMMLAVGAIRQQGQRIDALCSHVGLPPSHGVRLLPETR